MVGGVEQASSLSGGWLSAEAVSSAGVLMLSRKEAASPSTAFSSGVESFIDITGNATLSVLAGLEMGE